MNRFGKFFFASILLGEMLGIAQGAEQSGTAKSRPLGTFLVQVSKDKLYLDANQAPLVAIFQEIGKQAKITFDSNIGPEEKITLRLDRVPLEEGIKQLAKHVTLFYTENAKDKSRQITRVVVLSEGKSVSDKASPQPGKPNEPAPQATTIKKPSPQPEPFKFEFDPAKAVEREKPRKQP